MQSIVLAFWLDVEHDWSSACACTGWVNLISLLQGWGDRSSLVWVQGRTRELDTNKSASFLERFFKTYRCFVYSFSGSSRQSQGKLQAPPGELFSACWNISIDDFCTCRKLATRWQSQALQAARSPLMTTRCKAISRPQSLPNGLLMVSSPFEKLQASLQVWFSTILLSWITKQRCCLPLKQEEICRGGSESAQWLNQDLRNWPVKDSRHLCCWRSWYAFWPWQRNHF